MESSGGQAFKKPPPRHEDAPPVERDDVRVLTNRCPFCHDDIHVDSDVWIACARCFARHHDPCWGESGACGSCGGEQRLAPVPAKRQTRGLREKAAAEDLGATPEAHATRVKPRLAVLLGILATLATVLGITLLTFGQAGLGGPVVYTVLGILLMIAAPTALAYQTTRLRKLDKHATREASEQAQEIGTRSFPVRYSSEKRFKSWWKMVAYEATGALSVGGEGITLTTRTAGGTIERRFHTEDATLEWKGQNFWPNGASHWFVIEQDGERVYFTSQEGRNVFTTEALTREIFEALRAGDP
ncbi:MAG: hypothetical protein JKY65_20215 [Planctomycetes bacterium]|nr:hypothetical protein [Planctomycetota bacterium]